MSNSELLNVSGKKKTVEDLIAPSVDTNKRTINDIPDLLAAGNKKTFPVGPPSDILSRVQAFLPQLKNANEQLKTADPKKLDIENVEEEEGQYIEMNLGLGVYEEKKPGQSDSEDEENSDDENDKLTIPNSSKNNADRPTIEVLDK